MKKKIIEKDYSTSLPAGGGVVITALVTEGAAAEVVGVVALMGVVAGLTGL
jgi:hypothetical protein